VPTKQYFLSFKGIFKRANLEYKYYTQTPWSLNDVGNFWDTVKDYDEVNETLYTYFLRFTNSYKLAKPHLPKSDYKMLDIQARSGKGTLFWHEKRMIKSSTLVDFSDWLISLAEKRLRNTDLNYECVKVLDLPLPFDDKKFNLICSYETIEHIYEYGDYFRELTRVLEPNGIMIMTCPNISWEWVHWLTAILNINHSEGPHRFRSRSSLIKCINQNNMVILEENNTIMLPFNNKFSITINKVLEKILPKTFKSLFALRRTLILRKK
jgi:ubiquinone/menaquinone biosynthesis C-methylase UbiE